MTKIKTLAQGNGARRRSAVVVLGQVFALSAIWACRLQASFIAPYSLAQFTLTNTNADGSAVTPDGGVTLVLTGGNNGSGLAGTTDFVATTPVPGNISFSFSYSACSPDGTVCDTPGYDFAGYTLDTTFTQLADTTGQSGAVTFAVDAGQSFGFRVGTLDNTGEPGIITISDFDASSSVPEPCTMPGICTVMTATLLVRFARNHGRDLCSGGC